MALTSPLPGVIARRVLVVVEDRMLAELLAESLIDAGHFVVEAEGREAAERVLLRDTFDAAIIDLDTRARDGLALAARAREEWPSLTIIALLPCGGLAPSATPPPYQLAIEKPARLAAVLCAVNVAHAAARN